MNTSARRSASTRTCSCARSWATTTSPVHRGNVIVPDLATNIGDIHERRQDLHVPPQGRRQFGPPLNRAITSKDVLFAFQRFEHERIGAQYGFYYDVIHGMAAFNGRQGQGDLRHHDAQRVNRSSSR